jgi:transcriptional regulator with XRE-family HTH domain
MTKANSTKQFGALLRKLREKRGLGVNQLAGYAGASGAEISRIERGERKRINPDLLRKLAPKLNVTYEYLMQEVGYLPEKIAETGEAYASSEELLTDLEPEDKKLVLALIERLKRS